MGGDVRRVALFALGALIGNLAYAALPLVANQALAIWRSDAFTAVLFVVSVGWLVATLVRR